MTDGSPLAPQFDPLQILAILTSHSVDFVVIGGVAATLHGSSQVTFDLDVVYEPSDENVRRLSDALSELRAVRVTDPELPEQPTTGSFQARIERFASPAGPIDALREARRVGDFAALRASAEQVELRPKLAIWIASIDNLIWSKSGSGRAKDPAHIRSLERVKEERQKLIDAEPPSAQG